jgi:hypothetical protein
MEMKLQVFEALPSHPQAIKAQQQLETFLLQHQSAPIEITGV